MSDHQKPTEIWGGWVPESEVDRMMNYARAEERERCAKLIESGGDGIEGFLEMAIQLGANGAFAAYIRGMK